MRYCLSGAFRRARPLGPIFCGEQAPRGLTECLQITKAVRLELRSPSFRGFWGCSRYGFRLNARNPGHHTCLKFPDHEKLRPICFFPVCSLGHPPTYVRTVRPGKTLGKTLRTGQEGCFPNLETVSRPNLKRGTSLTATKDAGET